jgi:hypothetical protein
MFHISAEPTRSSCRTLMVVEESAQPWAAPHAPGRVNPWCAYDQLVAKPVLFQSSIEPVTPRARRNSGAHQAGDDEARGGQC